MSTVISLLFTLLFATMLAPLDRLTNGDFERGRAGDAPTGWFLPRPSQDAGFTAETWGKDVHEGKRCVRIAFEGEGKPKAFGNLMQSIDAAPLRGKRVRLKAAVRVEGRGTHAQMWLRVDRTGNATGFFDNMGDRPVRSDRWTEIEIIGDVDEDAQRLAVGFMLFGSGAVYLDAIELEELGEAPPPYEPQGPKKLNSRALDNLVVFTRLYGYARYFHPSDQVEETDWERLALAGVHAVEGARNKNDLMGRLSALFSPIAPTLGVHITGKDPRNLPVPTAPDEGTYYLRWWHHKGLGKEGSVYRSARNKRKVEDGKLPENAPDPDEPFRAEVGGGLSCILPLAVFADSEGTLPRPETASAWKLPDNHKPSGDDRLTRLADVVIAWNVFEHFYPYFDAVETDWESELPRALSSAAEDEDARAFLDTLRRMVAALHDGHGNVSHPSDTRRARLPFLWDWVEGELVVTQSGVVDGTGPVPGDVVTKINGVPVARAFDEVAQTISGATPQWIRWRALSELARGPADATMELELRSVTNGDKVYKAEIGLQAGGEGLEETRPEKIAQLEDGIFYVDLGRISDEDFEQALPQLAEAAGIVFDMRGYPGQISFRTFFPHLVKESSTSPQWHFPIITRPGAEPVQFTQGGGWQIEPEEPYLAAKRAFLTDGRAISYAESCMGIVEHYGLGEIVGGSTAGTNGNINPFVLPGGYHFVWTGMKVLKHDGSQHHGVGILPTIPVARTRAGVAAGRDELLERALAAVR